MTSIKEFGKAAGPAAALHTFDASAYDSAACVANAARFNARKFGDELYGVVPRRPTWLTAVCRGSRAQ